MLFPLKAAAQILGPVAQVHPVSPLSHFRQVLASHNTVTQPSLSVKSMSFQLKAAFTIAAPVSHLQPCGHCGTVKLSTALWQSPLLVTQAQLPGAPVVVDPTQTVAAFHVSPFSHFKLEYWAFLSLLQSWLSENKI